MNRGAAIELLDRLHLAQNEFYAGGSGSSFSQILTPSITWTIPGNNDIAGTHHGLEEVLDYFRRRRGCRTTPFSCTDAMFSSVTTTESLRLSMVPPPSATSNIGWSTVGLYDVVGEQISACWLLPLDPHGFDKIWTVPGHADDVKQGASASWPEPPPKPSRPSVSLG